MEPSGAQIAIALTVAYTDNDRPSTPHPIRAGLWVINVATRTPQLLVAARCQGLAWSPNGRTGAYEVVSRLGVSSIDTVTAAANARPKQIATLTDQAKSRPPAQTTLSWSRDGKTIVVCNVKRVLTAASSAALETEIDAYPAKGGPPTTIPAPVSYPTKVYQGAAYSPTGQSLVGAALHCATSASNSISSLHYAPGGGQLGPRAPDPQHPDPRRAASTPLHLPRHHHPPKAMPDWSAGTPDDPTPRQRSTLDDLTCGFLRLGALITRLAAAGAAGATYG